MVLLLRYNPRNSTAQGDKTQMYDKDEKCPYCGSSFTGHGRNQGVAAADAKKKLTRHRAICKQNPESRAYKKRHK